jgi:hypothetical protein
MTPWINMLYRFLSLLFVWNIPYPLFPLTDIWYNANLISLWNARFLLKSKRWSNYCCLSFTQKFKCELPCCCKQHETPKAFYKSSSHTISFSIFFPLSLYKVMQINLYRSYTRDGKLYSLRVSRKWRRLLSVILGSMPICSNFSLDDTTTLFNSYLTW